ncbi:MAG: 50S ribosomal protein L25 [Chroococcopsis gigantea SAG 12.99]|jgi:large subunit ribosomal protein L25|nr:50S ribosomal protein L25/general stress protein Ctc [Chlorogloea purpurea SAG 13.99]MDV3001331.1 50S ribosomal protein L25 [Chroococcopsis gigantea SAG 12.99]
MQVSIECQKRPEKSNPNTLRRTGFIPAALYGHNGTESVSLVIKEKDAVNMLKKASINNTLVDVAVPEMPWAGKALIKEVQAHPWRKNIFHISFFSVAAHGKLDIVVPLKMVGEPLGIKQGGLIEQSVMDINVECFAESIPEEIEVDITALEVGQSMLLGDLTMPGGVVLKGDKNVTVIAIVAAKK